MVYNAIIIGAGNKGAFDDIPGSKNYYKFFSHAHACHQFNCYGKRAIINLIGFIDNDMEKAKKAASIWGGHGYKSIKDAIIDNDKIDIISICTPDETHLDVIKESVAHLKDLKIIICEKPICTYKQIDEFKKLKIPVEIAVNYTRRYIKYFKDIKREIDKGTYGKFIEGHLFYNRGKEHTASHFVDLCNYFDLDLIKIGLTKVNVDYKWIFNWVLIFEKDFIYEVIKKGEINKIYNYNTLELYCNVMNFLEGKGQLLCNKEEAVKAIDWF